MQDAADRARCGGVARRDELDDDPGDLLGDEVLLAGREGEQARDQVGSRVGQVVAADGYYLAGDAEKVFIDLAAGYWSAAGGAGDRCHPRPVGIRDSEEGAQDAGRQRPGDSADRITAAGRDEGHDVPDGVFPDLGRELAGVEATPARLRMWPFRWC